MSDQVSIAMITIIPSILTTIAIIYSIHKTAAKSDAKTDEIHVAVNSRLSEALNLVEVRDFEIRRLKSLVGIPEFAAPPGLPEPPDSAAGDAIAKREGDSAP